MAPSRGDPGDSDSSFEPEEEPEVHVGALSLRYKPAALESSPETHDEMVAQDEPQQTQDEPANSLCEVCRTIDFGAASRLTTSEIIFESEEGWMFRPVDDCPLCKLCHWVWNATNSMKPTFSVTLCVWIIRAEHPRFYVQLLSRRRGHKGTEAGLALFYLNLSTDGKDDLVEPYINYDWMSDKLITLRSAPAATEDTIQSPTPATNIRLLDCYSLSITDATTEAEYVALSYVIGPTESVSNIDHTRSRVMLKNAPLTIRDAIQFTTNLGKRYLWVDRYCIRGNDPKTIQDELATMARIYANAWATVVSLGSDCNVAIPGVSRERTVSFSFRTSHGTLGLDLGSLGTVISHSNYATRGWVLQECLLSRCLIYATEGGAAVMDASGGFSEYTESSQLIDSGWLDARSGWMNANRPISLSGSGMTPRHFFRHIKDYCSRKLTRESDALDAIRGYLNILPWKSLWGIACVDFLDGKVERNPTLGFCVGLLWTNSHVHIYSSNGTYDEMEWVPRPEGVVTKSADFPSWSWTSSRWGTQYDLLPRTAQEFVGENFSTTAKIAFVQTDGETTPCETYLTAHAQHDGQLLPESIRCLSIDAQVLEYSITDSMNGKTNVLLSALGVSNTTTVELLRTQIFEDYHSLPSNPNQLPANSPHTAIILATSDSKTLDRRSMTLWALTIQQVGEIWYRTGLAVFDLSCKPDFSVDPDVKWVAVVGFVEGLPRRRFLLG